MTKYNYFGVKITNTGKEESGIQDRMIKGNKCVGSLIHVRRTKNISKNAEKRVAFEVFERKFLRLIYDRKKVEGLWRRKTYGELIEQYVELFITSMSRAQRM